MREKELNHLCGGTKVCFRVLLLCILYNMGSVTGYWLSISCLSWERVIYKLAGQYTSTETCNTYIKT